MSAVHVENHYHLDLHCSHKLLVLPHENLNDNDSKHATVRRDE